MNNLLDSGLGSTIAFGGEVVLVGMLTVFAVLILIWFTLFLFKKFFSKEEAPRKRSDIEQIAEPVAFAPAPKPSTDDVEIIAVIAAAIAAAEEQTGNGARFRVVSFKRK